MTIHRRFFVSNLIDLTKNLAASNFFKSILSSHYSTQVLANMSCKRSVEDSETADDQTKKRIRGMNAARMLYETPLDVSEYYVENSLRKVYPYVFTYYSYCKGRWVGKKLKELFAKEFRALSDQSINSRVEKGYLKVNGEPVDADYILKDNDLITNRIHRHEFPVLAAPIPIIHLDEDFVVIDKPPSLPVHACGKYRLNTIISILEKENNLKNLHIVHRLDRLTSGVMVLARTKAKAQKLHEQMRNREMHKEYVCRVEGLFPDGVVECDQPLETLAHRIGLCIVSASGKLSKTIFERLNYNGKSSTVLCKPMTGRMHQIRVHLQYLGYPIVNDSFYNTTAFGPEKGKLGQYGKSLEQLVTDIENAHHRSNYIVDESMPEKNESRIEEGKNEIAVEALQHYTSNPQWTQIQQNYTFDATKVTLEDDCQECRVKTFDPAPAEQLIYLHALRYKGKDWLFESQMPVWALETWTHD